MRWIVLFLIAFPVFASAAPLCTDTRRADDSPMRETDFDLYRVQRDLEWLESLTQPFARAIGHAAHHEVVDAGTLPSSETFAISYTNTLRQIRGALLRQRAELAEQTVQLARARHHPKEARAAQVEFEAARREFCDYLATARYAD